MEEQNLINPPNGGPAVGAYLRSLRDAKGLTASEVAEKAGTNQAQIWRIENWKTDTRSTLLFRFISIVDGNANDVAILISNPKATIADGETLARLRLAINSKQ